MHEPGRMDPPTCVRATIFNLIFFSSLDVDELGGS